jgi:hypothetical protein
LHDYGKSGEISAIQGRKIVADGKCQPSFMGQSGGQESENARFPKTGKMQLFDL